MATGLQLNKLDRRVLLVTGFAWLLCGEAAAAQEGVLSRDNLEKLIRRALAETDTTPLARPALLGLGPNALTTKDLEVGDKSHKHGFMVVIPRSTDGLVLYEGKDTKPFFFAMHRTGDHLRRIASATNRDGQLTSWSGPEADANFAGQKSFWAGEAAKI